MNDDGLYIKTDVFKHASVFKRFRTQCLSIYGLHPLHVYTSPGKAWSEALKSVKMYARVNN